MRLISWLFWALMVTGIAGLAAMDATKAPPLVRDEPPTAPDEIEGVWTVHGKDSVSVYAGITTIKKWGAGYRVQTIILGGHEFSGIGQRQNDCLIVSWEVGGRQITTLYRIFPRRLAGRWLTIPGDGIFRFETMRLIAALPVEEKEL